MTADQGHAPQRSSATAGDELVAGMDAPAEGPEGPVEGAGEPGGVGAMPPIPDSIREAGRLAPDHWLGMVDPAWTGEGTPPSWAVVGQWRSSPAGEIVEWRENEEYRPSPSALGWPDPVDEVDAAVQLAAAGYRTGEAVTEALAALPEAAVFVTPDGDPLPATAPDGTTRVVPVFTSPAYLHAAGRLAYLLMSVRELADRLPAGHMVYLNPSAAVSMTVDVDLLREALAGGDGADVTGGGAAEAAAARVRTVGGDLPPAGDG